MAGDIIVLRVGGSVLHEAADLPAVVHEIYRWYRAGWRVLVVASGDRGTDLLGEMLERAGVPARIVDPSEIRLTAAGDVPDGEPVDVDRERLAALLDEHSVIVVSGSDLSAVFLASAVRANRCRFLTDIDGICEPEPVSACNDQPRHYVALSYALARERAATLIQATTLRFLERHSASVEIASLASPHECNIGPFESALVERHRVPPTSVWLLGLGTVGFGVYQRILQMPEHFRVAGALVRDRAKHAANGVPQDLLHGLGDSHVNVQADVVVDALTQFEPSRSLAEAFLVRGSSVVSANKILIAKAGQELAAIAARNSASLLYSAAVGGSAPMIEALRREALRGEIRCIAGILNGICNHVLDCCAEGLLLPAAAHAVREQGYTGFELQEALSGRDATHKFRILARHAFGQELSGLVVESLNTAAILRSRAALKSHQTLRVIARAWRLGERVLGQIRLEAVAADDVLAQTRDDWNRLVITRANSEAVVVTGRGCGRWPVTEAVMGDLFELRFGREARVAAAP